jgi:tRNA threonylcarbamoyladenosine biosynthesis protein TsaE
MPGGTRVVVRRTTGSARETFRLGRTLGRLLAAGDVVALTGELGAGKTQLVRGACQGAGVPEGEVSSPTFAIVASHRGRLPVHHADLYRVGDLDELYATGFLDLVGADGAVLVEWADRVPGALPEERMEIHLAHLARRPEARRLEIVGQGERHAALARALAPRRRPAARGVRDAGRKRAASRPAPRVTRRSAGRSPSVHRR